ncbi:phage terminase small subunit P27 family [uncultured Amphritea sp.]|uniref:phage terminase small subunit P27 family n=1 Tax=uncultured Amphritea sp. TaxID=981605 RepID=UPI00263497D7|nr:phage terminase small subunit P27 family [uncultured Amphritea sp.]
MAGKAVAPGRGRKPKPNRQKVLAGSKHANHDAVEFQLMQNVDPPGWLDELAAEMWRTVCPHLCKEKVLAVTDLHNLEAFCSSYSTFRMAEQEVRENGLTVEGATGGLVKNPALTAKNEALRQIATFGSMLGLDPSARGRLMGPSGGAGGNDFSEF